VPQPSCLSLTRRSQAALSLGALGVGALWIGLTAGAGTANAVAACKLTDSCQPPTPTSNPTNVYNGTSYSMTVENGPDFGPAVGTAFNSGQWAYYTPSTNTQYQSQLSFSSDGSATFTNTPNSSEGLSVVTPIGTPSWSATVSESGVTSIYFGSAPSSTRATASSPGKVTGPPRSKGVPSGKNAVKPKPRGAARGAANPPANP